MLKKIFCKKLAFAVQALHAELIIFVSLKLPNKWNQISTLVYEDYK